MTTTSVLPLLTFLREKKLDKGLERFVETDTSIQITWNQENFANMATRTMQYITTFSMLARNTQRYGVSPFDTRDLLMYQSVRPNSFLLGRYAMSFYELASRYPYNSITRYFMDHYDTTMYVYAENIQEVTPMLIQMRYALNDEVLTPMEYYEMSRQQVHENRRAYWCGITCIRCDGEWMNVYCFTSKHNRSLYMVKIRNHRDVYRAIPEVRAGLDAKREKLRQYCEKIREIVRSRKLREKFWMDQSYRKYHADARIFRELRADRF